MISHLVVTAIAFACFDETRLVAPVRAALSVTTEVSAPVATDSGARITVALRLTDGPPLAGVQGWFHFDAARMRFAGLQEAAKPTTLTVVNDARAGAGELRVLSVDPTGLDDRAVLLAFDVVGADPSGGAGFELELLVEATGQPLSPSAPARTVAGVTDLPRPAVLARREIHGRSPIVYGEPGAGMARSPGQFVLGLRYGDATLNGAVDVLDAAYVANIAVGNVEIISGTDSPARDAVVAANVAPANMPGLGEPADSAPPGLDGNGGRVINVLDATAISNYAVGNPVDVVGELIPGRAAPPSARVQVSGTIAASRTFTADTVYELMSVVTVDSGAVLTVNAGTRIEGRPGAGLFVTRDGRIKAEGTLLQPIVLTCEGVLKVPGCWGGLVIHGYASVNTGAETSPPVRGTGADDCREVAGGRGPYGGCDDADSSGVLRFVRVEYAGGASDTDFPAGVALQGVGSKTVVDYVQVQASGRAGVMFDGGAVPVRHLVLTRSGSTGATWNTGWTGKVQFLVIQNDSAAAAVGLLGGNNDTAHAATPRSAPTVYNTTLVGVPNPGSSAAGPAVRLRSGTAGVFRNLLALRYPVGFDVDDTETCTQLSSGPLSVRYAGWVGNAAAGADESDCVTESSYIGADGTHTVIAPSAQADSQVLDPLSLHLPDWRLRANTTMANATAEVPPSDGFFDVSATYLGAVSKENSTGSNVPWYSGWTVGTLTGPAAQGTITGSVTSTLLGPIVGAHVRAVFGDRFAETDSTGAYSITGVPAGPATVTVANLPPGCADPGPQNTTVPSGGSATVNFVVMCQWHVVAGLTVNFDTTRVVAVPGSDLRLFRTDINVRFNEGVSDAAKAAFLSRTGLAVLGVTVSGNFFVRMPDPGPTIQDFYDAMDLLRAEPEVAIVSFIPRTPLSPGINSRFPSDGPGQLRTDWFGTSSATWAMRAVRAPLAWGCETGAYGGPLARIGILEWKHQAAHPEYVSAAQLRQAPNELLLQYPPVHPDTVAHREAHAVHTTGLLAARGDNLSGIAGMNWQSALFLYAALSGENRTLPLSSGIYWLFDHLVADNVRVLSISIDGEFNADSLDADEREAEIRRMAAELGYQLSRTPALLVVVAAGNEQIRSPAADYIRHPRATLMRGALLLLREQPAFRDRIVVVAGTQAPSAFWEQGSNFFMGLTDIAAPARDVRTLDRWTGQTGADVPLVTRTGTSLAAPLVAGVAGLLLAMDPTLTPAQLKDYLVRGARWHIGPNGTLDTTPRVTDAPGAQWLLPEPIWQLDAYGALTLLSRERPNTPVCGYPVRASGSTVYLEKVPGVETPIPVAGVTDLWTASVSQGGRRIAASGFLTASSNSGATVVDHRGQPLHTVADILERQYLEQDTADIVFDSLGLAVRLHRSNGVTSNLQFARQIFPDPTTDPRTEQITLAPNADWAFAEIVGLLPGGNIEDRWELIPLSGGATHSVYQYLFTGDDPDCTDCPDNRWRGAWSHDGQRATLVLPRFDAINYEHVAVRSGIRTAVMQSGVPTGYGSETVVSGLTLTRPRFLADDSLYYVSQLNLAGECQRAVRRATDHQVVGTPTTVSQELCYLPPLIFNAPGMAAVAQRVWSPSNQSHWWQDAQRRARRLGQRRN